MVWCLVKDCGWKMDGWCSSSLHVEGAGSGSLHAIAKAWLRYRLAVSGRRLVAVAVGLLRGHGNAGACCQHQLGCACKTHNNINLCHSDRI